MLCDAAMRALWVARILKRGASESPLHSETCAEQLCLLAAAWQLRIADAECQAPGSDTPLGGLLLETGLQHNHWGATGLALNGSSRRAMDGSDEQAVHRRCAMQVLVLLLPPVLHSGRHASSCSQETSPSMQSAASTRESCSIRPRCIAIIMTTVFARRVYEAPRRPSRCVRTRRVGLLRV